MSTVVPQSIKESREALADALVRQCLVEVYAGDEDRFSVGQVDALDETHFRLDAIDRAGRPNGIEVRALADVSRVETETDYLMRRVARLKALYERVAGSSRTAHLRAVPVDGGEAQRLVGSDPNLVRDALALSIEDGSVVTIWTGGGEAQYTGIVAKLSDDAGTILDLDEYGDADREVPFRIADVRQLDFGGEHQRIVQYLHSRSSA